MIGVVFALACWALFFLAPHNISTMDLNREAIAGGEYWRLWTAQLTHYKLYPLIMNSVIIAVMGLVVRRFAKEYQVALSLLIAMPAMTGLMFIMVPGFTVYRGAFGVAAVIAMMGIWFLILETRRFSLGYWAGIALFLLFVSKVGMETMAVFSPLHAHPLLSVRMDWLMQCIGVLIGLMVFNALHQIHVTNAHNLKQKQRRHAAKAASAASMAAVQRKKVND
ncbi:hypothetical protein D8Y20_06310 [Mariprofundus sp. EBB-1]|uniref:hypothetical protein n=1 Tax=Mariprofundus sp. EBB-1 TaxID=2650971 RepID=UPI000EF1E491|nr:hypothetical protein [Mariprofundus sp. EBB-1]RLL52858.1 hypothetical protein D8Y20_06310 [Mariprofundus sp. EBB-1]